MKNFSLSKDIYSIIKSINLEANSFNNKNIVISGSFGFIGKYILECLLLIKKEMKLNFNVYAIDNFITSDEKIKSYFEEKGINCINHNINKKLNIDVEFDFIICLAGIASPYYYNKYPVETLNVSINGLKNMFELKHNTNSKFIFFSSSEIYGNPDKKNIPTKETYNGNVSSIQDRSCYDEGKRVGETLCYFYKIKQKIDVVIFRPFNVFGPGMPKNDYRVFPRFFNSIKNNRPITIFKNGKQTRTFCYVTDAITAMFLVIIKGKKFVYNIGNDYPEINMSNLHKIIERNIKKKIKYKNIDYPSNYPQVEPQRRRPNINKIKKELNFKNIVTINDAIKKFYKWSKKYY